MALAFIFLSILIDVIGFGIIFPIIPRLLHEILGGDISLAAKYGGYLIFAYALMQFLFAPLLGNLSDSFGRRPILLISLFALGIDCLFMAFAGSFAWLLIGRILGGMAGGAQSVASAYIVDISDEKDRSKNFGLLNAAFGVGFIIGPVIGALLVKYGTHAPFLFAALLSFLNVIFGYFILPESLSKDKRRKFEWKRSNPVGAFEQFKKFPKIAGLLFAFTFIYFAGHSMESLWAYYTMEKFSWDERKIGYSLAFLGLMLALVQGLLTRFILPKIGDKKAVYFGFTLEAIVFLLIAFAFKGWIFILLIIPFSLAGIAHPAVQAIISKEVKEEEQGELQGAIGSLISLTAILSPLAMTAIFSAFSHKNSAYYFPGMPFIFSAFLVFFGLFLINKTLKKY